MSRKANRKINRVKTVRPTQVSTVRETVTLETPKNIIQFPSKHNREWLMRDVLSSPYAEIRS